MKPMAEARPLLATLFGIQFLVAGATGEGGDTREAVHHDHGPRRNRRLDLMSSACAK
jgi:hypothetical protein